MKKISLTLISENISIMQKILIHMLCATILFNTVLAEIELPELYQDVIIQGNIVHNGVRECSNRYDALKPILETLPRGFKSLDIGASQGYFSFRMAEDYKAQCTMIEDGYTITTSIWQTAEYLKYLCEANNHLKNITLLKKRFFIEDFQSLSNLEEFDIVLALSVIHHIRKNEAEPFEYFLHVIDAILAMAPIVIIENPINTGEHTTFIRTALIQKGGKVIYTSERGSLTYEIYLFDKRKNVGNASPASPLKRETYLKFNGIYTNA